MNILRFCYSLTFVLLASLRPGISRPQEIDLSQQVVVTTAQGAFVLSLYADQVPLHAKLFLGRVAAGAYDGTLFGYLVKWGVIQGGSRLAKVEGQVVAPDAVGLSEVRAETSARKHVRGTLSLVLDSNETYSGQFFICVSPQPALDGRYTPIGLVAEGMEVVDRLSETPTDEKGIPIQRPRMEKVSLRPALPIPPPPFTDTPPAELAKYQAVLETTLGQITIEFLPDLAPDHVRNFLRLAQAGFYDGTAFHRIARDFVLQGGLLSTRHPLLPDFRMADLVRKLKPEFNATHHAKGIVSMARYEEPDSAETSFFICLGDAGSLDNQYTVFGRVVDGTDVLDQFQQAPVDGETPKERLELKKVILNKKTP
jgi:cyclophilin family peptidyl-prolyl cis-trans isomerase